MFNSASPYSLPVSLNSPLELARRRARRAQMFQSNYAHMLNLIYGDGFEQKAEAKRARRNAKRLQHRNGE